jgi:hypothetical protein
MTSEEAKQILIANRKWLNDCAGKRRITMQEFKQVGIAIDVLTQSKPRTELSQAIYDAAVNWPQFLGNVECDVIDVFMCYGQNPRKWSNCLRGWFGEEGKIQARTFMLFVAEALND